MGYFIGVDIGTSGVRCVIYDERFCVVSDSSMEYPTYTPKPGYAEQDPDLIVAKLISVVLQSVTKSGICGSDIDCISLSSVMHSMIAVDQNGQRLTPCYIWSDLRSTSCATELQKRTDSGKIYALTGCLIHPIYLAPKICWLKQKMGDDFSKVKKILSIKDYVLLHLTGEAVADTSVASASGLLNLHSLQWEDSVLDLVEIGKDLLPEVVSPVTIIDGLRSDSAHIMNVPKSTRVVVGAADGTLSSIGAGVLSPDTFALMVGTSGAVRTVTQQPKVHPNGSTWCYHLCEDYYVPGGAINNGGSVLRWYRDQFGTWEYQKANEEKKDVYEIFSEYAKEVQAGCNGLVFLPFLAGERCPGWNATARGTLFGLTLQHGRKEVVRAIMEGVAYRLYSVYKELVILTGCPSSIHATGGFRNSDVWLQVVSDVFGVPLKVPAVAQGSAFGAAAVGALALGQIGSLQDVVDMITIEKVIEPDFAAHRLYEELYCRYEELYQVLTPQFAKIAAFQDKLGEDPR